MKFKYIIIGLGILILFFFTWATNLSNSTLDPLPKLSESIEESKKERAFIASYNVINISDSLTRYLKDSNLTYINLNTIEFWVEKNYHFFHKYIFIKKSVYFDDLRLIIEDPTSLALSVNRYPLIAFKVKGTNIYSGNSGMGGDVCVLNIGKKLPKKILLEVYLKYNDYEKHTYIGDLMIGIDI